MPDIYRCTHTDTQASMLNLNFEINTQFSPSFFLQDLLGVQWRTLLFFFFNQGGQVFQSQCLVIFIYFYLLCLEYLRNTSLNPKPNPLSSLGYDVKNHIFIKLDVAYAFKGVPPQNVPWPQSRCHFQKSRLVRWLTAPELQGDGAFNVVEMDVVSLSVPHHLLHSTVWSTRQNKGWHWIFRSWKEYERVRESVGSCVGCRWFTGGV